jgi:hypothetical protein
MQDIFNLLKRFQDLGFLRKEVKLVTRKVNKTASSECFSRQRDAHT